MNYLRKSLIPVLAALAVVACGNSDSTGPNRGGGRDPINPATIVGSYRMTQVEGQNLPYTSTDTECEIDGVYSASYRETTTFESGSLDLDAENNFATELVAYSVCTDPVTGASERDDDNGFVISGRYAIEDNLIQFYADKWDGEEIGIEVKVMSASLQGNQLIVNSAGAGPNWSLLGSFVFTKR